MSEFLEYVVKSGISLTVLYLFYWLVLQKDTHFLINRIVLMSSVIASMFIPAISARLVNSGFENLPLVIDFSTRPELPSSVLSVSDQTNVDGSSAWDIWKIIAVIYVTGAVIVFGRLIYQAIFLHAISKLSKRSNHDGFTIVSMDTDMIPFSYFKRIFIPAARIEENMLDSVISHEKSHLNQGHYVDLFIIELITVLQWFNPFIWLFEKSIKEVHEYLADESVLNQGENPGKYQAILVNQALGGPVFILTNQFNQSLIKKRIMMMKNMKTSSASRFKALLILPVIAGLLLAFANPPVISQFTGDGEDLIIKGNVSDRSNGKIMTGTVVMIKGTTTATVTDLEGNYQLKINSTNNELVFSQVGYRTQVIPVQNNTRINVQLEPDILKVDFAEGNRLVLDESLLKSSEKGESAEETYVLTEELPAYPGGTDALQKFILSNIQYPENSKKNGIQGIVLMTYTIDTKGAVTAAKVIRGLSAEIDREALRVTNLIKGWKPASQNGHPIPVTVTMPIEFKLN